MLAEPKTALSANTRQLLQYIADTPELRIADLSYTTTARPIQYNDRITFACPTLSSQ